jgi:pimeloyl-ACP methyl ester carboxylesterase
MDGTGELFREFVDALPREFEAVVVRYPRDRRLASAELLQWVRAACPAAGRFVLVAESYSTPLAIRYAATNPPNLAGIILCAGFASSPVRGWQRLACLLLAPILFRISLPEFAVRRWLVGMNNPRSLVTSVQTAIQSVWPAVLALRLRDVLACDVRAELAQVSAPMLCIQPTNDRLVSKSKLAEIRRIMPRILVETIEAPHLVLQRAPEKSAEIVASFVRGLA